MKQITIRRCPVCSNIGSLTNSVVSSLKSDPDTRVNVIDGAKGEFSVEVDGQSIYQQAGAMLPTSEEVVSAVKAGTRVRSAS
ncbi:MAG: hypothetical protein L0241_19665 [Planctomycetia bacterium]|nr:hypothetical protein [Planctomycetia bacterium]